MTRKVRRKKCEAKREGTTTHRTATDRQQASGAAIERLGRFREQRERGVENYLFGLAHVERTRGMENPDSKLPRSDEKPRKPTFPGYVPAGSSHFVSSWDEKQTSWKKIQHNARTFFCALCQVDCQSHKGFDIHSQGKSHRKKARNEERRKRGSAVGKAGLDESGGAKVDAGDCKPATGKKRKRERKPPTPEQEYLRSICMCSKTQNWEKAVTIYREKRAEGLKTSLPIYSQLLALCSDARGTSCTVGLDILKDMEQDEIAFDETAFSLAVKVNGIAGNVSNGKKFLTKMKESGWDPKRRTYAPMILNHSAQNVADLEDIDSLTQQAEADGIEFGELEFAAMLRACNSVLEAAAKATPGDGERCDKDDTNNHEPVISCLENVRQFFLKTLRRMQELVFIVGKATLDPLRRWAKLGGCRSSEDLESVAVSQQGLCAKSGVLLRSIDLTKTESEVILRQIATDLACESNPKALRRQKAGQNPRQPKRTMAEQFEFFKRWMNRRGGADVIIDGANVGYYARRPDRNQQISFSQIDRVIEYFYREKSRNIVLVMHSRHFNPRRMSFSDKNIADHWNNLKILYRTPPGMNDDWFWLYAAVWSGGLVHQPLVVTNDHMRDHHFQMLSQRCFLKWRERHVVNFGFANKGMRTPPTLLFPLPYSTRMQENRLHDKDTSCWHFPCREEVKKDGGATTPTEGSAALNEPAKAADGVPSTQLKWYFLEV